MKSRGISISPNVVGRRRLSEAISEGDGISVLALVRDLSEAQTAEQQGAEGLAVSGLFHGLREQTSLPILYRGGTPDDADAAEADAWVLVAESLHGDGDELEELFGRAGELGLECVVDVRDEEEVEIVHDRIDPEIFLLSPRKAERDEEMLDRVLELLPDIPAGKLAVAELHRATKDDVQALERAGVDAVLVGAADIAQLAGPVAPDV